MADKNCPRCKGKGVIPYVGKRGEVGVMTFPECDPATKQAKAAAAKLK